MKRKRKIPQKYRRLLFVTIGVAAAFAIAAVAYVAVRLVAHLLFAEEDPTEETYSTEHFKFERPDWEANIFEDEEYLELNRRIMYRNGGEEYPVDEGLPVPDVARMFVDYLDAIMHGDAGRLKGFYTAECLEELDPPIPDAFTMQRVYDAVIIYNGTMTDPQTEQKYERISLIYKIQKNDGTFRTDIESDAYREQKFYVIEQNGEYRIADMVLVQAVAN